jgi:hypothetical protein
VLSFPISRTPFCDSSVSSMNLVGIMRTNLSFPYGQSRISLFQISEMYLLKNKGFYGKITKIRIM